MTSLLNTCMIAEYKALLDGAEACLLVDVGGMTVAQHVGLRSQLGDEQAHLRVVKNRLVRLALREQGLDGPADLVDGQMAVLPGDADQVVGACRIIKDAAKTTEGLGVRGALFEGMVLGSEETAALADIPDRPTLLAQVISAVTAPVGGLLSLFETQVRTPAALASAHAEAREA